MGQPIRLIKDGKPLVVYGLHQAAVHIAEGYKLESGAGVSITADDLSILDGATESIIQGMTAMGITTYQGVVAAEDLTVISGVGKATAEKLKASASKMV